MQVFGIRAELSKFITPVFGSYEKIFAGVLEFPARVKCASLSWHTLNAALRGEDVVSTE